MNTESSLLRLLLLAVLLVPLHTVASLTVDVSIEGLSGEPLANVQASLTLAREGRNVGLSARDIREMHAQAPREISRALEPFGYYRPRIEADLQAPARAGLPWRATYRVELGRAVPLTQIHVVFEGAGANDEALGDIAAQLPLEQGQDLDHRQYEAAKPWLLEQVRNLGYTDAYLAEHRVEVDLAAYSAAVALRVATGARYTIGDIQFVQDDFSADYLARYLLLKAGDRYTVKALAEQRRALSRSGYFREVEVLPLPASDAEPHVIPLRIRLETLPRNRYRARLAWGTDTGAGGQLDWSRRYVGGRGQHFTAGIAAVEERDKVAGDLNYVIPLDPLAGSRFTLGGRHESKDLTYQDVELTQGGETRITTNLLYANWQPARRQWAGFEISPKAGFTYVSEDYDVFEVLFGNLSNEDKQTLIDEIIGRKAYKTLTPDFSAIMPTLRVTLRRSDDRLFINKGDYLDLQLLVAEDSLGSNLSFWQARLDTWHIRPVHERGRLLLRASAGYSDANSSEVLGVNFNEMPEYYEFRAGGARSVRGYSFEELIPKDSITGGKHELVGSVEYDHEFIRDWSAAVFVDAGNAFNEWDDYDAKVGVGIGLRWRSPVGVARIDVGVPLDDSEDSFQVYITVGPEF